jgi:serine/threonine-protein kinase
VGEAFDPESWKDCNSRFAVVRLLGRGGMGEVVEARDRVTGELVALKRLRQTSTSPLRAQRLRREADAALLIASPFVPRLLAVIDVGDDVVLAMERLEGETLSARLRDRTRPMEWPEISAILHDLLRGLIDAHTAGVIHRDLKPANIMLVPEARRPFPRAMILDFGICKVERHRGEALTEGGATLGTVAYMAPEQIRGSRDVDERADLYALALVAFECVAGQIPFGGPREDLAIVSRKLEGKLLPLETCARTPIPAGLPALLARGLSVAAAARPATAQEFLRAIRELDDELCDFGTRRSASPQGSKESTDASSDLAAGRGETTASSTLAWPPRVQTPVHAEHRIHTPAFPWRRRLAVGGVALVVVASATIGLRTARPEPPRILTRAVEVGPPSLAQPLPANSLAVANGRAPVEVGPPSLAQPLPANSLAVANGRAPEVGPPSLATPSLGSARTDRKGRAAGSAAPATATAALRKLGKAESPQGLPPSPDRVPVTKEPRY